MAGELAGASTSRARREASPAIIVRSAQAQAGADAPGRRAHVTSNTIPALLRRGAAALAAGRVALGLAALAWPSVPARPWVGAAADDLAAQVFGRALGARDLALGLGALAALRGPAAEPGPACAWVAAGALADALDVAASLSSWRELPSRSRWLVVTAAGGAPCRRGRGDGPAAGRQRRSG